MRKYHSAIISALLAAAMLLQGCGASASYATKSSADNAIVYETTAAPMPAAEAYAAEEEVYIEEGWAESPEETVAASTAAENGGIGIEGGESVKTGEKLVYTCYLSLQSVDFEETRQSLNELIRSHGGIVEQEEQTDNAWNWYFEDYRKSSGTLHLYLVVRIPSDRYFDFLDGVAETESRIISQNQHVENITRRYSEVATTIESLQIQEKNLLEMMDKAETIEEMITVEARLSEVQNELKMHKNDLSRMDTDVAYSTVTIDLEEVLEYKEEREPRKQETFVDRLKASFENSWDNIKGFLEGLLFFIIEAGPILILVGGIVTGIVFLILAIVRKSGNRKAGRKGLAGEAEEKKNKVSE